LCIQRVETVPPGLYRYLALEHKLLLVSTAPDVYARMNQAIRNQGRDSAVIFAWTALPYRTEWRYTFLAHKLILLDAGHVCQNLYLACEAIGAGTCAIDAYNQTPVDELLGVDGVNELTVYCATVGKVG
jgi:SagB-type dehydrogenase family enzyme